MTAVNRAVLGPEIASVPNSHPFRLELNRWLADHATLPPPVDEKRRFEVRREWQRTLHHGGWAGPAWPKEYGGRGAGPVEQFMYYEELALARTPEIANTPGIVLVGPTMMVHGSAELKEGFLPGILSGEDMWCQGFSEPNAGSDLAALRTIARRQGDEWVINGQKTWTTSAEQADYCVILCRTDLEVERHRGISMLIVPMDQPGVLVRPIVQINGFRDFAEVFFDDARAPAGWIVGEAGHGWAAAMTMLEYERGDPGFTCHGRLLVMLADMMEATRLAQAQGRLAGAALSAVRLRLAELWTRCQALRRLNLRVAVRTADGRSIGEEGSMVKVFWSELKQTITECALDVHGAAGLHPESQVAFDLLWARAATIYSGTNEIQRNVISQRVLGLPR